MISLLLLVTSTSATFFSQTPCGAPCPSSCGGSPGGILPDIGSYDHINHLPIGGGCPQAALPPPCPAQPTPVCPQHPPCPQVNSQYNSPQSNGFIDQFVQPLQQETANVNSNAQPTVIYLDQVNGAKGANVGGARPQVVYQSLPSGGSRLIVPPGSDVYALQTSPSSSYQIQNPTVLYNSNQYPTAAVENLDELDLKGLEWGIPLKPTEQQQSTIEAIERLAEAAEAAETTTNQRRRRALALDDVISEENEEEYGDMISSEENVETIEEKENPELNIEEEVETTTVSKKNHEKTKKRLVPSLKSSKKAHENEIKRDESDIPHDNDIDRKKCNSRRLYEIMLENMNESSASSKRNINKAAEDELGVSIDVVCSRGHFSYVFSSNLYCEASKGHVTCIAFKQAPPSPSNQ